jgi:predicted transcriptional regulator
MLVMGSGPTAFDRQVRTCMHRHPKMAHRGTSLSELARELSAVPTIAIVDELENVVGVVSRTDLVGRRLGTTAASARVAADVMTRGVIAVPSTATMRATAQVMAAHAVHQVYVVDDRLLVGVITAMDITASIRDAGVSSHLSTIMTTPPIMIGTQTELGVAVDLLSRIRVSGLVVVEDGVPVGTFTHLDALEAYDLPRRTPIEELYEAAVLCLPMDTPLHTTAAHMSRSGTQRVLACSNREVVGVATSLDFVRYVAW